MQHLRWDKHGRTFTGDSPNEFVYKTAIGQQSVDLGDGTFAPYVWDSVNNKISYANHSCQFFDWYQVIKDENGSVLIDDQRFTVEYWRTKGGGSWRVLDLYQTEVTAVQNDDNCVVTRRYYDASGNELKVEFLFRPVNKVHLTFTLTVATAGTYRIRFQNTGIAGEATERAGNLGLTFEKIWFAWKTDEASSRTYAVEKQANGKKLDIFLGSYTLTANQTIVISPDTWGATGIAAGTDDGYNWIGDSGIELTATNLYCLYYFNSGYRTTTGFRFQNVTIAQGSTITSGTLSLFPSSNSSGDYYGTGKGIKEVDTATFASGDIWSGRTACSATNSISGTDAWSYGSREEIAGWEGIIEEIVGQGTWASGNDLGIWIDTTQTSAPRSVCSYESTEGDSEPRLTIVYTAAGGASAKPSILARGVGVGMFKGMTPGSGQYP